MNASPQTLPLPRAEHFRSSGQAKTQTGVGCNAPPSRPNESWHRKASFLQPGKFARPRVCPEGPPRRQQEGLATSRQSSYRPRLQGFQPEAKAHKLSSTNPPLVHRKQPLATTDDKPKKEVPALM